MPEMLTLSALVQAALRSALAGDAAFAGVGVFEAPPPGARPPYVTVGPDIVTDRGWKGVEARLHRLTVTAWVGSGSADGEALPGLMAAVERVALVLPDPAGARLLSVRPERSFVRRQAAGLSAGVVELRIISVKED